MIVEHRTYTLFPGNTSLYLQHYIHEGMAVQLEYLPNPLGYYTSELGVLNQVVHLWGYQDLLERARLRERLKQDPRWRAYVAKILPLIQHQESQILTPAPFYTPQVARFALPG